MKMLWVLLTIGLTFADKLDRTYLPPSGSTYSGGSLGDIKVPFEQSKIKYSPNDEGILKTPQLVIGIDRVGPNQVFDTFEEISTHKPKLAQNYNTFTSPTETKPSISKQFPLFKKEEDNSTPTPAVNYNSDPSSSNIDNSQQFYNNEKELSMSLIKEYNRMYLPPHGEDMIHTISSITSLPVNNENVLREEYSQSDLGSDDYSSSLYSSNQLLLNTISTIPPVSLQNINNVKASIYPNNPDNSIREGYVFDKISTQRPERIQAESDRKAVIINYGQTLTPEEYAYGYDTSNGIHADEEGIVTNGVKAKGSYSYIGDDGNVYEVVYTADENGFVPKGAHLPTAPPIPDLILKVIEQAVKDKEAGVYDDGSYNEEKYGYQKYQEKDLQNNNFINPVNYPTENGINMELNKEVKEIENHLSEFENNFDTKPKQNNIQENDNTEDDDLQNINLPSIKLNKNNYVHSSQEPENKLASNKLYDYFDITSEKDSSLIDKNYMIDQKKLSGYEYFPPTSSFLDTELQSLPSRFLGTDQDIHIASKENMTEKVTAKPFLTPYVTRKGDDLEINDFDEQEYNDNNEDDPIQTNYSQGNAEPFEKLFETDEQIDSNKFIVEQQPQFGERIQDIVVSPEKEGYYYQNTNKPLINLSPRVSYTSPYTTTEPSELPNVISTTNQVNRTPGSDQSAIQTNTTLTEISSSKSSILSLPRQTTSPVILKESTPDIPDATSETDFISTPKSIQTPGPGSLPRVSSKKFKTSTTSYSDINSATSSTKNEFGEDFSGPKQPQRFDPISGYHY